MLKGSIKWQVIKSGSKRNDWEFPKNDINFAQKQRVLKCLTQQRKEIICKFYSFALLYNGHVHNLSLMVSNDFLWTSEFKSITPNMSIGAFERLIG